MNQGEDFDSINLTFHVSPHVAATSDLHGNADGASNDHLGWGLAEAGIDPMRAGRCL